MKVNKRIVVLSIMFLIILEIVNAQNVQVYVYVKELHDVALIGVMPSAINAYNGEIVNITVVIENKGSMDETFDVTTYYDSNIMGIQSVTNLAPGIKRALIFNWDTTEVTPCSTYTIKAEASQVPTEANTGDNIYIDGITHIKIPGDINGDGIVDIIDIVMAAISFGSTAEDNPETPWDETEKWDPNVDLNNDGIVDIIDIVMAAIHFGESC